MKNTSELSTIFCTWHSARLAPHNAGNVGYEIPPDVGTLLDQLRDLAEDLGLPKEEAAEEAAPQPGEDKPQKKLPPQLNPLLAKLARAAARENDKSPGMPAFSK